MPIDKIDNIEFLKVENIWLIFFGILTLPAFGFGLILIIMYFLTRKKIMIISSTSGSIGVLLTLYGLEETMNFTRLLGEQMNKQ